MGSNFSEIIRQSVSMEDIVKASIPGAKIRNHRTQCPFHHGKNDNLMLYADNFYCFKCHAAGDEIKFIELLFNISFQEAQAWINRKFNLHLDEIGWVDADRITRELKRKRMAEAEKRNAAERELTKKLDELYKREKMVRKRYDEFFDSVKPSNPDENWKTDFANFTKQEVNTFTELSEIEQQIDEIYEQLDKL